MCPASASGLVLWLGLLAGAGPAAEEQVLFGPGAARPPVGVVVQDARILSGDAAGENGTGLRVATGHANDYPGVTIAAPGGTWDLGRFAEVTARLENRGSKAVTVYLRVDNAGADGIRACLTGSRTLGPGETGTLRVPLKRAADDKLGGRLFGMRGYPVAGGGPGTLDPTRVTQMLVFVSKPRIDHEFGILDIRAAGRPTPPTAWTSDADPFFPFIDTFGQYRHKDWPGKTHTPGDLAARREQEARELADKAGPAGWDRLGGWADGPQLKATGYFRTEKVDGRWWLVDPDGRLFFSHGIDCVRMLDATPTEERAGWFEDLPAGRPEFRPFVSRGYALHGHYAGRRPECFSFAAANLVRKYGPGWRETAGDVIQRRLRSWGLNTIGNWSDGGVRDLRRTPYTDAVSSDHARRIEGGEGYWGKFPDVFDPSFAESLRRSMAGRKGHSAADPWCIGYFSDNELSWGDETAHAVAALRSPADQPAKKACVGDLQAKYPTIGALNQAWGTNHASWEALMQSREPPDRKKAHDDLAAFSGRLADEYFRQVRAAIKEVAPSHLYLGCRFAWVNDRAALAAVKHCDVVSYNLYRREVADFRLPAGADAPLLIGEFHFGALDRGMFHTGLVPVASQEERARVYADYVRGALRHPQFVGCHWFQYQDEPTTGRVYDEENYQIGFVDIADTPYAETVAACRDVAAGMYRLRSGAK